MKRADSNIPVPLPDCEVIGPAVSPVEHLLRPSHGGDGLLFVVAHPDDEVIGAGAHLPLWRKAHFIHVSDGAPQNLTDAKENGFNSSASYARARRQELERALLLAHVEPAQIHGLGFADQEVSRYLLDVVKALANIIRDIRPTLVVTHPYEGGHPDHDATAFAVHSAIANLKVQDGTSPALVEMTSYYNRAGIMQTGEFLSRPGVTPRQVVLSPAQRHLKQQMFDCFCTQKKVLQYFPIVRETFRTAPLYNFTLPPHDGKLYYELFDWGMTGPRWRKLVSEALQHLATSANPTDCVHSTSSPDALLFASAFRRD